VIVMIELLKSAAFNTNIQPKPGREAVREFDSEPVREPAKEDVVRPQPESPGEAATLSGAIQRLIAERDGHKSRAGTQELELTRLRAVNDELRRRNEQTALIRDHYMRLATEVLTTFKHIDYTIHEVVQKTLGARGGNEGHDATLISLARRLSPKRGAKRNVENHL
jgi:hypothetical protein